MIHDGTRLILKSDAAPFRVLIDGPESLRALQERKEKEKPKEEGAAPSKQEGGGP